MSRGELTKGRNVQLPVVCVYLRCGTHGAVLHDIVFVLMLLPGHNATCVNRAI